MPLAVLKFNVVFCFAILSIASLLFFAGVTPAYGQDDSLDSLKQQWSALDKKFAKKEAALNLGEVDTKTLREDYQELVDQANELIKKMKPAAIAAIKSDANDGVALQAIMGILLNEAQQGNDAEVLGIGDELIASGIDTKYLETAAGAERLSIDAKEMFEELLIRQREATADDLPRVKLTTTQGEFIIELYENEAPNTVANFISLVESGFYDGRVFHRVLEDYIAQTGCPNGDGLGGPGYQIACECYSPELRSHFSGCVSMAHAGRDTAGSQFFLTFARIDSLDGKHTCFGRIISGIELLDKIERTHLNFNGTENPIPNVEMDKILKVEVVRKRDHDYHLAKVGDGSDEKAPEAKQPPASPDLSAPGSADAAQTKLPELSDPKAGSKIDSVPMKEEGAAKSEASQETDKKADGNKESGKAAEDDKKEAGNRDDDQQ